MSGTVAAPAGTAPGLAVFDFDGTLIAGDSLMPFLEGVAGRTRTRLALARAIQGGLARHAAGRGAMDLRTTIKSLLLVNTLAGVPLERARAAGTAMRSWVRWHPPMVEALRRHKEKGDTVVVATGALSLYMPGLLEGLPVDALLATGLEVREGLLTGRLEADGNCVREEKARRLTAWMAANGPFAETYGYGNRPSDLPFLALMRHPTIVKTVQRRRGGRTEPQAA